MDKRETLNNTIIKNLMLEVLGDKEFCNRFCDEYNFENTAGGHKDDLFRLVELKAIEKGFIDSNISISKKAWGTPRHNLVNGHNTNFTKREIEILWETFYMLLTSNIIGPGVYRDQDDLPWFHITEYGKGCIDKRDILPHDVNGYMGKLTSIENLDQWVEFYMLEALKCYNANCYNSSVIMIGLASETLAEQMIEEFILLCRNKNYKVSRRLERDIGTSNLLVYLDENIKEKTPISTKYVIFEKVFNGISDIDTELKNIMDTVSRSIFINCLRVSRNEVAHPSEIRKDESEVLLLFIGFIKYCEMMTKMISKMKELNE